MAELSISWDLTLAPPKKFQYITRTLEVIIIPLRLGHAKATKSHIFSWGPQTTCHHGARLWPFTVCSLRVQHYIIVVMNTIQLTHWKFYLRRLLIVEKWNFWFFYPIWTVIFQYDSSVELIPDWCNIGLELVLKIGQHSTTQSFVRRLGWTMTDTCLCRTINIPRRTFVVVKQMQSNLIISRPGTYMWMLYVSTSADILIDITFMNVKPKSALISLVDQED